MKRPRAVLFGTFWGLRRILVGIRSLVASVRKAFAGSAKPLVRKKSLPKWFRDAVQKTLDGWAEASSRAKLRHGPHFWLQFQKRAATRSIPLALPPRLETKAAETAQKLGLGPHTKIVTLHVRESSFKTAQGGFDPARDATRNAAIRDFFPAVDYLVSQGFTVVRVGDPASTPVSRQGLVDLAASPLRTDLLEIWCVLHSRFFIGCDSGATCVSWLVNVPSLVVNIVNPLGVYPLRENELHLLKRVMERRSGRVLSIAELMSSDTIFQARDSEDFVHIDNSEQDLLDGVVEMVQTVSGRSLETEPQREYRRIVEAMMNSEAVREAFRKKGYLERPYVGQGRIVHAFAERFLHRGEARVPALQAV
jgi:putative glycosyltransferase (TIGR04372 family)